MNDFLSQTYGFTSQDIYHCLFEYIYILYNSYCFYSILHFCKATSQKKQIYIFSYCSIPSVCTNKGKRYIIFMFSV